MPSTARVTLDKARFFLERARETKLNERQAFIAYFEAAIVFARSITFHLQKEFASDPDFSSWYSKKQQALAKNRFAKFLLEQRNYVLKEGPVATKRVIEVTMTASLHLSGTATVKVIRGAPWYKRPLHILIEDATYPIRSYIHRLRERRAAAARARRARQEHTISTTTRDEIYFADDEWQTVPAVELIGRQLDAFEAIVSDAEERFTHANESVA